MSRSISVTPGSLASDNGIPKFAGNIWYVDGAISASGAGTTPDAAFKTIGEAIAVLTIGDAITIKAATYTETGLDLNVAGCELWFEIGALIQPASGTALTISGNSCAVMGMSKIVPAAGQIGVLVSGTECHIEHMKVSTGGTGFCITGLGAMIVNCAAGGQTVKGYDLQAGSARLTDCKTQGVGATYGYYINNGADTGVLSNCTSVGHETAGYYIATGSADWTIFNCSSGAGDGKRVDVDLSNVWSNYRFDNIIHKTSTFTAAGPGSINLFQIYGTVRIANLSGTITTVLAADIGNAYLELYDQTNTVDVTDSPGPSFASLPVNSFIHKIDNADVQIAIEDSSQVRLYEDSTKDGRDPDFLITAKEGAATYLRLVYSGTGTSGAINWSIDYVPKDVTGHIEPA